MKHINKIILFSLVLINHSTSFSADQYPYLERDVAQGMFDYDPEMNRIAEESGDVTITRLSKSNTVGELKIIDAEDLLQSQNSLYLRSNPLGRKNVIDLPIFQNFSKFNGQSEVSCLPFYTQTYKEYFYAEYDAIKRYINLKQDHLIRKLDDINFTLFDIPQVLSLF